MIKCTPVTTKLRSKIVTFRSFLVAIIGLAAIMAAAIFGTPAALAATGPVNANERLASASGEEVVAEFEQAVNDSLDPYISWSEIVPGDAQAQWETQPANLNLLADVTDAAVVWALKTKGFDPNTEDSQGTRAEKIGIVLRDFDSMSGYKPGFGEVEGVANSFGPRGFVNPIGASNAFWAGHGR